MRYIWPISITLLSLAWLLLLICMFLPVGGFIDHGVSNSVPGWRAALLALEFGPFLSFGFMINPVDAMFLPLGILLSQVLFIASPFVLALESGHLISRSIYLILNLLCVFFLACLTPYIVDQLDPNNSAMLVQLLPGFVVWLGAQVFLTLATGVSMIPH